MRRILTAVAAIVCLSASAEVLVVPAEVRQIDAYAYRDRTDITEVRIEQPSQLSVIGDYAFAGCENLKRITGLPERMTKIGEGAFRECVRLREFDFPWGVREVARECFIRCSSLRSVTLPADIVAVGSFAFTQCSSLRRIDFPSRLKSVGLNAFALCTSLREAELPETVTELGSYAFAGCASLRRIELPANPSRLGELILEDCPKLKEITELSPSAPAFECNSWLADPVADPEFYKRVRLRVLPEAVRSFRKARGWRLFDFPD